MDDFPTGDRTAHATGERVAIVETKIAGIERDTTVIRATLHSINGEMQKFVVLESQCVSALERISEQTKHLPDFVAKLFALDELKPPLQALIAESQVRKGAWKAYVMVGTAIVGAVAIMGTLGTGIVWLIDKVVWR